MRLSYAARESNETRGRSVINHLQVCKLEQSELTLHTRTLAISTTRGQWRACAAHDLAFLLQREGTAGWVCCWTSKAGFAFFGRARWMSGQNHGWGGVASFRGGSPTATLPSHLVPGPVSQTRVYKGPRTCQASNVEGQSLGTGVIGSTSNRGGGKGPRFFPVPLRRAVGRH